MAIYRNGRYAVTGPKGLFSVKKASKPTYRVVNTETRKLASPDFRSREEALFHADSLVASHRYGGWK